MGSHRVGYDWSDLAAAAEEEKEEEKKKGYEKIFEEIIVENFPNMEKERVNQVQYSNPKSPIQDKPKKKHTKTHTNQTNKD